MDSLLQCMACTSQVTGFVLSKYPGRAHCLTSWVRPHVNWACTPKFKPYGFGPSKTLFFLFFYWQLKEACKSIRLLSSCPNRLVWGSQFSDQALVRAVSNDIVQGGRLPTGRNYSAWLAVTIEHPSLDFSNKLLSEMLGSKTKGGTAP